MLWVTLLHGPNHIQVLVTRAHRDRTRACMLCCFGLIFSSFEHAKNLLIMGPNNTKDCPLKCDFLILRYELFCPNLVYIVKNTKLDQKLFLCYVSKPRAGPISSPHNNFKWGNIFAGVCTLVLSLCSGLSQVVEQTVQDQMPFEQHARCQKWMLKASLYFQVLFKRAIGDVSFCQVTNTINAFFPPLWISG
jgi:hypothetical protein